MKQIILLMTLFFTFLSIGRAQESESYSQVSKEYNYENETSEKEVTLEIENGVNQLLFSFQSEIESGKLEIQIYDPNGKKEGRFKLESKPSNSKSKNSNSNSNSNNNSKEHSYVFTGNGKASGNMNKSISSPISGSWTVKITTQKVTGTCFLQMGQQSE